MRAIWSCSWVKSIFSNPSPKGMKLLRIFFPIRVIPACWVNMRGHNNGLMIELDTRTFDFNTWPNLSDITDFLKFMKFFFSIEFLIMDNALTTICCGSTTLEFTKVHITSEVASTFRFIVLPIPVHGCSCFTSRRSTVD